VDPNPKLFDHGGLQTDGSHGDSVAIGFDSYAVTGFQTEFVSEELGHNDATGLVDRNCGHEWYCTMVNAICKWHLLGSVKCCSGRGEERADREIGVPRVGGTACPCRYVGIGRVLALVGLCGDREFC